MPIGMRFIIYYACFRLNIPVTNEIANTKITAPSTDGTIAIPAICGPQEPKIAWPSVEPTSPAMILARKPIEPPPTGYDTGKQSYYSSDD